MNHTNIGRETSKTVVRKSDLSYDLTLRRTQGRRLCEGPVVDRGFVLSGNRIKVCVHCKRYD